MSAKRLLVISVVLLLAIGSVPFWLNRKPSRHACAAESQAAVETWLRQRADGAFAELGPFIEMTGEGFYKAVWNIQGYDYITLDRTAKFASNSIPLKIFVTEAPAAATNLGKPRLEGRVTQLQGARIFIRHPGV